MRFSNALNETLGTPKTIKAEILPESFQNLKGTKFGSTKTFDLQEISSRSGKSSLGVVAGEVAKKSSIDLKLVPSEDPEDLATFEFDTSDIDKVVNQFKTPTREAYKEAIESLARLEEQAILSNAQALKIKRDMRQKTNPNHYGTKSTKRSQKLHKPAKFFGNSKDIIYVRVKGEVKPMSMKNAKKFGHI